MTDGRGGWMHYDIHGFLRLATNVPLASVPEHFRVATTHADLLVDWCDRLERPAEGAAGREMGHTAADVGGGRLYFESDIPVLTWLGARSRWRFLLEGLDRETTSLRTALEFGGFRPIRTRALELLDALVALIRTVKLAEKGYATCHGSLLSKEGSGLLFMGYGGTGKTTMAHLLRGEGWDFLADDAAILDDAGVGYSYPLWNPPHPLRSPRAFARYLAPRAVRGPRDAAIPEKTPIRTILLLERGGRHVEPISRSDAARRILLMNAAELARLWANPLSRMLDAYAYFVPGLDFSSLFARYRRCLESLVERAEGCYLVRTPAPDLGALKGLLPA